MRWNVVAGWTLLAGLVLAGLLSQALPSAAQTATPAAQTASPAAWLPAALLSDNTVFSWFPDIAGDERGRVHVAWETSFLVPGASPNEPQRRVISIMHRNWDGAAWSAPNDLISPLNLPSGHIYRVGIAAGPSDRVYLTFNWDGARIAQAPAEMSWSAGAWSAPALLTNHGAAIYMSDVAVDARGGVHAVWDQLVPTDGQAESTEGGEREFLSDLFYARSIDGGRIWKPSLNLSNTPVGCTREQIEIDPAGTIWVSWDEGWDRLTEKGKQESGWLVHSTDGGETWSAPVVFDQPEKTNVQLATASDGRGTVLAVWRATTRDEIFYSVSRDGARTWTAPAAIPGLYARAWEWTRFDAYDLAVDGAGVFHLAAVARRTLVSGPDDESDGLYHLAWDGTAWSAPEVIFGGEGHAEYPRLALTRGNQLHAVWFLRDQEFTEGGQYKIWYSRRDLPAPALTPAPTFTASPLPPATATLAVAPTRTPLRLAQVEAADTSSLYTENDDVGLWLLSLTPAVVMIAIVALAVYIRRRRSQP